jgi:hypothetical protein
MNKNRTYLLLYPYVRINIGNAYMSRTKEKFSKILIAIDGSEQSMNAVDYAIPKFLIFCVDMAFYRASKTTKLKQSKEQLAN